MESRHDDPTIMLCLDCDWTGQLKDCTHAYVEITSGAEPIDYCPKCGSVDIIPEWFLHLVDNVESEEVYNELET